MAIESLKNSTQYANDLQSAMQNNPLKQDSTSANDREKAIKESAGKIDAKSLMTSYVVEFQMSININSSANLSAQNALTSLSGSAMENAAKLNEILSGLDLKEIGYSGKPLQDLTQEEAQQLISEDGFFGITQTSNRIADFVLMGAGDDIEKLKAGREGIITGYNQAEKAWGDTLPEISQKTLEKALEKIDQKLANLGVNVLDTNA
ncbi:MAG: hydrogenase-4 component G [Helicobacteraceae bacterium]|nr:hydrogenase-4 component G [Helicobacteraceae bacterium]